MWPVKKKIYLWHNFSITFLVLTENERFVARIIKHCVPPIKGNTGKMNMWTLLLFKHELITHFIMANPV